MALLGNDYYQTGICELVTFSQAIFTPWQVKNTWYSIFNYI
jgi:hypothetical protein